MKKLVLFFSFFLFAFILSSSLFLIGCKSDTIYEPYIVNPPPDTLGNVSGFINSLDEPIEDAYLTLNNKTTFSDSNGFFEFKDCVKKNSVFTTSHPEFSEYSNSINVTDSLNLDIALTRVKYDYFPLKVGNKWQYHYIYFGYTPVGGFYNAAKIDWEVTSKSGSYPNWIYNLKETFLDSTDNSLTARFFNIIRSDDDSITFLGVNKLIGDSKTIRRYFTSDFPESIYQMDPRHGFKRNIGFIEFDYGFAGGHIGNYWRCEIIDYSLY